LAVIRLHFIPAVAMFWRGKSARQAVVKQFRHLTLTLSPIEAEREQRSCGSRGSRFTSSGLARHQFVFFAFYCGN
jgi:hypothetical protein